MKCPRCQAQNRDGLKFCEDCDARLALACQQCGAAMELLADRAPEDPKTANGY